MGTGLSGNTAPGPEPNGPSERRRFPLRRRARRPSAAPCTARLPAPMRRRQRVRGGGCAWECVGVRASVHAGVCAWVAVWACVRAGRCVCVRASVCTFVRARPVCVRAHVHPRVHGERGHRRPTSRYDISCTTPRTVCQPSGTGRRGVPFPVSRLGAKSATEKDGTRPRRTGTEACTAPLPFPLRLAQHRCRSHLGSRSTAAVPT